MNPDTNATGEPHPSTPERNGPGRPVASRPRPQAESVEGPVWTAARLRVVLALLVGTDTPGRPDTAAVAATFGVSRRQVQRWIRGRPDQPAQAPTTRLQAIAATAGPSPERLDQEQREADYAWQILQQITTRTGRIRTSSIDPGLRSKWEQEGWLTPHLLAVVHLPELALRRPVLTRATPDRIADLRRQGELVDLVYDTDDGPVLPTYFHAVVVRAALLEAVHGWRVQAPATVHGRRVPGRTQTFTTDAPTPGLRHLAAVTLPGGRRPSAATAPAPHRSGGVRSSS